MDQASPDHRMAMPNGRHTQTRHNHGDADLDDSVPDAEFVEALLAALTGMAVRSPRRQADLAVALRRSGIEAAPAMMLRALQLLEEDGCIEHLVPLTDGGLLMQVTAHGIERLSQTSRRHVLDFGGK